jgi:hypothetical protein
MVAALGSFVLPPSVVKGFLDLDLTFRVFPTSLKVHLLVEFLILRLLAMVRTFLGSVGAVFDRVGIC